jgi:hypothetical protein
MGDSYQARPATQGDLSAVQLCGKFDTVIRLSAPSSFPTFCFLTGCTPDYLEADQTVYCTAHAIPVLLDSQIDKRTLSQLRLLVYKPFRAVEGLSTPTTEHISSQHLASGGFPHLHSTQEGAHADADSDSELDFGTMDNSTIDSHLPAAGRLPTDRHLLPHRGDAAWLA